MMSDIHQEIQELAADGMNIDQIVEKINMKEFVTPKLVKSVLSLFDCEYVEEDADNVF